MYVCPHCQKQVKDLKSHLARVHPEKVTKVTPGPKSTGKKLELVVDPKPKEIKEPEAAKTYHCIDCGGALTKGQTPCPSCGATLNWGAVA